MVNLVVPGWCEDHRTQVLGICPFCRDGLEPIRFIEARQDFRDVPLAGTLDILPHEYVVRFADVVGTLGQQLVDLERRQQETLKPFQEQRKRIARQMKQMQLDPIAYSRAVRVYLGIMDASAPDKDPRIAQYLEVIRQEDIK